MLYEQYIPSFDGTPVFVSRGGEGVPVVLCDGLGCDGFIWRYLKPRLAERHHVVHWNYRGHGRTRVPWDHPHLGIDTMRRDLLTLLDELELPQVVLLGHSMGVQVIFEFALQHPDRVLGVVPICGSYGRPLDTFHDNRALGVAFPYLHAGVRRFPRASQLFWNVANTLDLTYELATRLEVDGRVVSRPDFQPYFDHLRRMDIRTFMRVLDDVRHHTVEDRLPQLRAPTLIIAGDRDTFTPVWLSRRMARIIPGAELLVVPHGSHIAPIEHREVLEMRVERFLRRIVREVAPAGAGKRPVRAKGRR